MPLAIAGYVWLKFFHVLLAIIAVGFNASYAIWISRAVKAPEHELHVLKGVKILDDRFANPAYGLLLITGILTANAEHLSIVHTLWLKSALGIYIVTALTAALVYTPTLKRQITLLEAGGAARPNTLLSRGAAISSARCSASSSSRSCSSW